MDAEIGRHFAAVIDLARQKLDQVEIVQEDISPARAILELHGLLGSYDIRIKEIFSAEGRLYSYYVLSEGQVVVGFDNYPDVGFSGKSLAASSQRTCMKRFRTDMIRGKVQSKLQRNMVFKSFLNS